MRGDEVELLKISVKTGAGALLMLLEMVDIMCESEDPHGDDTRAAELVEGKKTTEHGTHRRRGLGDHLRALRLGLTG